jgi:hypothetical protein
MSALTVRLRGAYWRCILPVSDGGKGELPVSGGGKGGLLVSGDEKGYFPFQVVGGGNFPFPVAVRGKEAPGGTHAARRPCASPLVLRFAWDWRVRRGSLSLTLAVLCLFQGRLSLSVCPSLSACLSLRLSLYLSPSSVPEPAGPTASSLRRLCRGARCTSLRAWVNNRQ